MALSDRLLGSRAEDRARKKLQSLKIVLFGTEGEDVGGGAGACLMVRLRGFRAGLDGAVGVACVWDIERVKI